MNSCTFFGHKDCPPDIKPLLLHSIENLILEQHIFEFYVGHNGQFDILAIDCLTELSKKYPTLKCAIVLSKLPTKNTFHFDLDTVYPEVIDTAPARFAIDRRNTWMVAKSDVVIAYIKHSFGGAYKFVSLAKQKGKTVINLNKNFMII